ncbi:MAG: alpha/beta hydrolase [Agarilytica sp.]
MPTLKYRGYEVYYEHYERKNCPTIIFVNGLSMRTNHWEPFVKLLTAQNISVLLYDMLGQGSSSKPVLGTKFSENADAISAIMSELEIDQAYISGISFGGVVVEEFALRHPEKVKGLIPISTFSELDGQLHAHSLNLHMAMTKIGFEAYLNLLMPLNFTSPYLDEMEKILTISKRITCLSLDVYGIQNLMESLRDFKSITHELNKIEAPTLILNAEYDFFTPRHLHEKLRQNIKNSRLMIIQHYAHAFTLEIPDISCRIIKDFIDQVEGDNWVGDQSVWIAEDNLEAENVAFPSPKGYLRCVPITGEPAFPDTTLANKENTRKTKNSSAKKQAPKKPVTKAAVKAKKPRAKASASKKSAKTASNEFSIDQFLKPNRSSSKD